MKLELFIIFSMLFTFVAETEANRDSEISVTQIKSGVMTSKKRIINAEEEERRVLSKLYTINQKMKKMSKRRDQLANRMLLANSNVKDVAKDIAVLEGKIGNQKLVLSKKLKTIYKVRSSGILPILFSAKSSHELDRVMKYLKVYSEKDFEVIKNYKTNVLALKQNKRKLKQEVVKLIRSKREMNKQERTLEKQQLAKSTLLSSLSRNKKIEMSKLSKFRRKTKELIKDTQNSSLAEILDDSFFMVKGQLQPPVEGYLVKGYGVIQNPVFKYRLSHKGHFYSADRGEEVKAIHGGKVSFAGEIQGYGKTVIIDHGDHYYTLYSNLEDIVVSKGLRLLKKQTIAKVGQSSKIYGSGVYFEIRHFSDAIDPKSWLIARNEESN